MAGVCGGARNGEVRVDSYVKHHQRTDGRGGQVLRSTCSPSNDIDSQQGIG